MEENRSSLFQRTENYDSDRLAVVVLILLLGIRLFAMQKLGVMYTLNSDDLSYINSGLHLLREGIISMHTPYPSAQIMPGMTLIIACVAFLVGENNLWIALKMLWIIMGVFSAWFVYKTIRLFTSTSWAVLGMLPFFRPDFIWMDNLILTETPSILCFTILIYSTFMMGISEKKRHYLCGSLAYLTAVFLKASIGLYPLFAGIYLLSVRYDWKKLLRQGVILGAILVCLLTPWSIRNYVQFGAFIPLTYGSGNPLLLGTYQGINYPLDDELDYENAVEKVVREKYSEYYNEDGTVDVRFQKYISLQKDGIKARYRMREWINSNVKDFLVSYLLIKPMMMANDIFYWERIFDIPASIVKVLQYIDMVLCVLAIVLVIKTRKLMKQCGFLVLLYWGNVYLHAIMFAFGRYNISLMPARFILISIGISVFPHIETRRRIPRIQDT